MKREFSSGGAVYKETKENSNKVLWLVTKSNPTKEYPKEIWRLPKGWLDDSEDKSGPGPAARGEKRATEKDLQEAAKREVAEEGGVKAEVIKKIQTIKVFFTWEGEKYLKFITYYLMRYINNLPNGFCFETSEVRWLSLGEAVKILSYSSERQILKKAASLI